MKSILLASKPSNNNQLSVGTQIRRNESSPTIHHQHHYHLNNTNAAAESAASEQIEKEHFNKLFSNSKKQVIRSRCSVDKLKRVSSSDSKSECLIKLKSSDSDYLENRPLIGESKSFSVESENHKAVKLINLRKKNGTTLIFQRKSKQKANEYRELESLKKRRSLQQWPNAGSTNVAITNANRHSWYDPDYYPRAIEEEFDDFDVSIEYWARFQHVCCVDCNGSAFVVCVNRNNCDCLFLLSAKLHFVRVDSAQPIKNLLL